MCRLNLRIWEGETYISAGPARYEESEDLKKPNPSCNTSKVPSPINLSPFLALFLSIAKIKSCLRILPAFSILSEFAKSTSSVTGRCFRSDKCIFF